MIAIDSDVFLIDLRYPRDQRFGTNARFLEKVQTRDDGLTTIFNLLEVCGVLSFNLNPRQLKELYSYFPQRYHVAIVPAHGLGSSIPRLAVGSILRVMEQRASLGDAQIIASLRTLQPEPELVVTWDVQHFSGRLETPVLSPADALRML